MGRRQVVVDRRDRLPEGDNSSSGVVTVPVQHVGLNRVEDGARRTVTGTTTHLLNVGGRRPSGNSYDCGPGGYWGGHQQLARTRHRVKVRKGS